MIFGGIISLALVLLAFVLMWSQNSRIKVLEFELRALQKAFMAMRDRLDDRASTPSPGQAAAGKIEAAQPNAAPLRPEPQPETQPVMDAAEASASEGSQAEAERQRRSRLDEAQGDAASGSLPRAQRARPDFESALGGRWAVWVGGLALALGGLFLVRYSIEAGLLGPKVRLVLATMLGLAATAGGEFLRRSGLKFPVSSINGAYLPGILTAAGAFVLFGTVYAAHGFYGFIGPTLAFVALGAIAIAAIALSLLHGQAFGGLGVIGSLATPALVSSEAPNPWALFGFLAIVLVATSFIARIGRWWPMMSAATAGVGLWSLAYLFNVDDISVAATGLIALVSMAVLLLVWLRPGDPDQPMAPEILIPVLATAVFGGLQVLSLAVHSSGPSDTILTGIVVVVTAMILSAAWKQAALPLLIAAGVASVLWQLWAYFGDFHAVIAIDGLMVESEALASPRLMTPAGYLIAALFLFTGFWQARKLAAHASNPAAAWALFAVLLPLLVIGLHWTGFGNINIDFFYAFQFLALAALVASAAELIGRAERPLHAGGPAVSVFAAGGVAAPILAIHAGFGPGLTAVLCGMVIALPALVYRIRTWAVLPVLSTASSVLVIGQIAVDPSIVGELDLGKTPVFNWLLPGYAVPAIGAGFAAWQLKRLADGRMRMVQEAFAALFALLTAAILVRHAMTGGELSSDTISLAEQAIYTLIAVGGGAVLIALDTRSPSPVFRIGSMIVGGLSMIFIVISHFVILNPLVTNESTGTIPVFNLLMLAYLLPAAAMAALALYARPKRPKPYVACLGLTASALAFGYVTLTIRRLYWGEFIGQWKGLTEWETYTYSAAWLILGAVILVIGIRLNSTALRLASAALIVIAVAKVFLFDMSQLEGVLRALSFIGLGVVLIGIGIFYQRMMAASRSAEEGEPQAPEMTAT